MLKVTVRDAYRKQGRSTKTTKAQQKFRESATDIDLDVCRASVKLLLVLR